jgi:crotonobetainyl-CoA:carnitine CoA-transferase CaiB-like acyl-CoA transferase
MRPGFSASVVQRQNWSCKEGAISFIIHGRATGARTNRGLVEWMDEEGMADDFLRNIDWQKFDLALITQEFIDQIIERFGRFFITHTSAELYRGAKERRIMLYPVTDPKDIAESPQLAAREFWEEVDHPELNDTITYPGAFLKATEMSLGIRCRAPLIGEHNEQVYGELGISGEELLTLKQGNII